MRKTVKLLTILLSVAVLLALTVVAVSAAGATRAAIPAKYLSHVSSNFQDADFSYYGPTDANAPASSTGFVGQAGMGSRVGGLTVASNGLNKYMQYYHANHNLSSSFGNDTSGPGFYGAYFGSYRSSDQGFDYGVVYYDYVTMDYDICADMYLDENNMLTELDTGKVSYIPIQMFFMSRYYKAGGSAVQCHTSTVRLNISYTNNEWVLYPLNNTSTSYKLPENAGEWTHITWAIEIDNSVTYNDGTTGVYDKDRASEIKSFHFTNSKIHIYINGEYFYTFDSIFNADVDDPESFIDLEKGLNTVGGFGFDQIRFNPMDYNGSATNAGCKTSDFSMGIDNISVYYYYDGYDGQLANHIKNNTAEPIYSCNDVVFAPSYQMPYPNRPVAQVTDADGDQVGYYIVKGALDNLSAGGTLELFADSTYAYSPEFPFTIVHNGYDFALDPDTEYIVSDNAEEGKYSVRKALTADYGDVIWDYKGDLYEVSSCIGGQVPKYPGAVPSATQVGNQYKIFKGWSTEKDATTPSEIPTVEPSGELMLYPVYDFITLNWAIFSENGELYTPTGGLGIYSDTSNVATNIPSMPSGSTLVLYSDVQLPANQTIVISGKTVSIDLNGYKMFKFSTTTSYIFELGNKTNFHIYSSREGGEIYKADYAGGLVRGTAVVYANSRTNVNVKFGNGTDNLTINAPILCDFYSPAYKGTIPETPLATLTIDGGTYIRTHADSASFLIIRAHIHLDIKNATLISKHGVLISQDARYQCKTTGTIEDSVLYSVDAVISQFHVGSELTIKNTDVIGGVTFAKGTFGTEDPAFNESRGLITYAEGTRYSSKAAPDGVNIILDGTASASPITATMNYWSYTFAYTNQFVVTKVEGTINAEVTVVEAVAPVVEEPAQVLDNLTEEIIPTPEVESAPVVENTVVENAPILENVTMEILPEVQVAVKAPVSFELSETVELPTTVSLETEPTVQEIILSLMKGFLNMAALPVTKNTLFII